MAKPPITVSTSDRQAWKRCRLQWSMSSKHGLNYEPAFEDAPALTFGTTFHRMLETYYNSRSQAHPRDDSRGHAIATYAINALQLGLDQQHEELGLAMTNNYLNWCYQQDQRYKVIATEAFFEVPIRVPEGIPVRRPLYKKKDGTLRLHGRDVHYTGKIDMVLEDTLNDQIWIVDHKTTSSFNELRFLEFDDQVTAYMWGLWRDAGILAHGVMWWEYLKKAPTPPKRNKNGRLSVAQNQRVLADDFRAALKDDETDDPAYKEFLEFLEERGNPFFRRTKAFRTKEQLLRFENLLIYDVMELLAASTGREPIFRNPTKLCNSCAFADPCLLWSEGGRWKLMLEDRYIRRGGPGQ